MSREVWAFASTCSVPHAFQLVQRASSPAGQKLAHEVFGVHVITSTCGGDALVESLMQGSALFVVQAVVAVVERDADALVDATQRTNHLPPTAGRLSHRRSR
jgi:hypothetical protein